MKLNRFGFSLELINLNNNCVKTIFVSLYLFVRSQTSLDHLVLSSEARRYLTFDINTLILNPRIEQRHKALWSGISNTAKQIGFLLAISKRLTSHVLENCCLRIDSGP
jgi:hypothetical protein